MRILAGMFAAIVLVGGADAQILKDPPWNPDHINRLPAEVRHAVLAMCPATPDAGHYFATYSGDQINLHFEHFHCENARSNLCNGTQCLHQVYKLTAGHYHLAKSFCASRND
ncbi:MAG: hypothetical protein ACXU9C_21545 [Xanthobacteraceae bacterium]